MSHFRTNPFRDRPAFLAQQPRLIRLYIFHSLVGFALSAVFTALILWTNTANIGHLVANVDGGWLAALIFFVFNGIVFAGVQTGIVIMSLGSDDDDDDDDQGGGFQADRIPVYVRHTPRR